MNSISSKYVPFNTCQKYLKELKKSCLNHQIDELDNLKYTQFGKYNIF